MSRKHCPGITTILTLYRRPYTLKEQLAAVRKQSCPPSEVWLWVNDHPDNRNIPISELAIDRRCVNDHNWKYYGRFALALLATTEYVAIFDDDSIPGVRWFENCLSTMESSPGILGTGGVRLHHPDDDESDKYGWIYPSDETVEVDFVGQAWFLRREWVAHLWRDGPATWHNGEDMHLAYAGQRYAALRSFCPPHPSTDLEMHGSVKGAIYDTDAHATSVASPTFWDERAHCIREYLSRGWKLGRWPPKAH